MSKYDLIGFDMDGTLVDEHKNVSAGTLDALKRASCSGKQIFLSTGRCISELMDYTEQFRNIRYYVCESGALLYDSWEKRTLYTESIPRQAVEKVIDIAGSEDVMFYFMSEGIACANAQDIENSAHFYIDKYLDLMDRTARKFDDILTSYREQPFPVDKLNLYAASTDIRERLFARIKDLPVATAYAETTSIELSPPHITKASGLIRLCRLLQIPLERTIIVGDADNDIEAMKTAGLSIAMGNALPHIKNLCDVTVADNEHDGCVEAIDQYLLAD